MKNPYQDMAPPVVAITLICQAVACGALAWAGYLKLTGHPAEVELFERLGMGDFGRQLIGVLEIGAVLLLVIPQSGIYGALLGVGLMCGAIIAHVTKIGFGGPFPLAVTVLACCLVVMYTRRHEAEFLRNLLDR